MDRALDRLAHRGPDARGVHRAPGIVLAHTRLSIIDPEARSDQPFRDQATGVTLTYNGEVFNYRELRKELEELGLGFATNSDTEVVLRAYLAWGTACLGRLNGMFAFGIYDPRSDQTLLARDRIGVKPLYYAELSQGTGFASQPQALLAWPGVEAKPDPVGISSFLSFRSVVGSRSLFSRIRKLEPGCMALISGGVPRVERWWHCRFASDTPGQAETIRELLGQAVERQLVSDVPVATLLSGGVDSSILAYEISRRADPKPTCFTGVVRESGYDESGYASSVARQLELNHELIDIPLEIDLDVVTELVQFRGHPLGMHNETAMYALAKAISREHKVVMTGEGADEIFAGYSRLFRTPFDFMRSRIAESLPSCLESYLRRRWELPREHLAALNLFLTRYSYFPRREKLSLANSAWRRQLDDDRPLEEHFAWQFAQADGSFFDAIAYIFTNTHLPALLEMVDNTTMAASVEGRVPYTDDKLVTAALALPEQEKLRWKGAWGPLRALSTPISKFSERLDTPKYVLKRLYQGDLPKDVLWRQKMGFPLPLGRWAAGPESRPFRDLVFKQTAAVSDFLDIGALRRWYDSNCQAPNDGFGKKLWLICNLEIFLRRYAS